MPTYKSMTTAKAGKMVKWEAVEMQAGTLCHDDHARPIRMEVFESRKNGNHRFMGSAQFTLLELLEHRTTSVDIITNNRCTCVVEVEKIYTR